MTAKNISQLGNTIFNNLNTCELIGGFMGDGVDAPLILDSRDGSSENLNATKFCKMSLNFAAGASTLDLEKDDANTTSENIKITGVRMPIQNDDLATLSYIESQTGSTFDVQTPVVAGVIADLQAAAAGNAIYDSGTGTLTLKLVALVTLGNVGFANITQVANTVEINGEIVTGAAPTSGDRVIFAGMSSELSANGVYEMGTIAADVDNTCVFTRVTDADLSTYPIISGKFVLVNGENAAAGGNTQDGYGYYLRDNVADATADQNWVLFSTQNSLIFKNNIRYNIIGTSGYTIAGDPSGTDEGKVLTAQDAGGQFEAGEGQFTYAFGKTDTNMELDYNNITINSAATNTLDSKTDITLSASNSCAITGQVHVKMATATGANEIKKSAPKHEFATSSAGTTAVDPSSFTITSARESGAVTCLSSQYTVQAQETFGAGVLLDNVQNWTVQGGTTRDLRNRFIIVPRVNAAATEGGLAIATFDNNPASDEIKIIAIIEP